MEANKQTYMMHWGRVGKLVIPIGTGLLLILIWVFAAHGDFTAKAAAATLYVDGSSGDDHMNNCLNSNNPCATIAHAISESQNDYEILVAQGTYSKTFTVTVTVTLKGGYDASDWLRDIEANQTVIDPDGSNSSVIHITPDTNFTIEGFTVQHSDNTAGTGRGLLVNNATVLISATIVQDNEAQLGGGIHIEGDNADVWIQNSSLLNNQVGNSGGGLHNGGWGKVTLYNSDVQGNISQNAGGGIWATNITITGTQIMCNTSSADGGGITGWHTNIYNSQISDNTASAGDHTYGVV